MLRLERHPLGPRVYVLGRRIHEYQLGLALAAVALCEWLVVGRPQRAAAVALVAAWLVVKDWRDLLPARRDSAAWRPGLHRRPCELRPQPRGAWLPPLAASAAAIVGAVDAVSALTPNSGWRARLL